MSINLYDEVPPDWLFLPLKRTITAIKGGVWGDEPDGISDLPVVRVADIDRQSLRVRDTAFTVRSISLSERNGRRLTPGDLLIEKSGGGDQQLVGTVVSFNHEVEAVCSNFMAALKPAASFDSRFLVYMHSFLYRMGVTFQCIKQTTGIQNIDLDDYLATHALIPPLDEQKQISIFLDRETARIDSLINAKENYLTLVSEKRRALITSAVTRGIDPTVQLKEFGISWLGPVPEHWGVTRAKNLFREIDLRSSTGEEILLSLRMKQGLVPHNDVSEKLIPSEELIGYKIAEPNQIVVNRMRAASGLIAIVPQPGIVSPDYAVFEPKDEVNPEYYTHLFTTPLLQAVFRSESKGLGTGSSGFLRLYSYNFLSISMPKPPIAEQAAITAHIQTETVKLDTLKAATEHTITLLRERRAALIAAAVTGVLKIEGQYAN